MIIKIEKTDKALSAVGSLLILKSLFDRLIPHMNMENALPKLKRNSLSNYNKLKNLLLRGPTALTHLDRLAMDESFAQVNDGRVYTSRSQGDFLIKFNHYN